MWSQISSNFLTRCFTTCRRWGFTAPFQLTAPLGAFPNESQTAVQLDYLADWPAVPPATSVWSQHTLATQPHPGNKSLWTSLECLLSCQMIVSPSKVQTLSALNTSLRYQRWSWDKSSALKIDPHWQYCTNRAAKNGALCHLTGQLCRSTLRSVYGFSWSGRKNVMRW